MTGKICKTEEEWQQQPTPEQFEVTRSKCTERTFTGKYHDCKTHGPRPTGLRYCINSIALNLKEI